MLTRHFLSHKDKAGKTLDKTYFLSHRDKADKIVNTFCCTGMRLAKTLILSLTRTRLARLLTLFVS